jgi:hypothetical protein
VDEEAKAHWGAMAPRKKSGLSGSTIFLPHYLISGKIFGK